MDRQALCGKCDNLANEISGLKEQLKQRKRQYESELKAHDVLFQDFQSNLENESENRLQTENLQVRQSNQGQNDQDRIKYLEIENQRLLKINEEIEEETRTRDSALDKAQVLIRKLNDECEITAKKLSKSEKQIEQLKKQLRQSERQFLSQAKQIESLDTVKRTEERIRQENAKLKEELQEIYRARMNNSNEQQQQIESLLEERAQLNQTLENLSEKIAEIEKENQLKDDAFETEKLRNQELQQELENSQLALQKLNQELKQREQEMDLEVQHIKRQAENVLRSFTTTASIGNQSSKSQTNLQSPLKRQTQMKITVSPSTSKMSPEQSMTSFEVKGEHNELLLQEVLQRENSILKDLGTLSKEEGRFLQSKLNKIQILPLKMRPELER